jgi:hypothetical protein
LNPEQADSFNADNVRQEAPRLTPGQARIIADALDIYEGAEVFDDPNIDEEVIEAYSMLLKIAQTDD